MNWTVEFYEDEQGFSQVKQFLDEMKDVKLKAKILRDIQLLQEKGHQLKEPYVKHLEDDIWELRTKQSSNISRILYFSFKENKIVLLNGFTKKTRKTPPREIERARKYRDDHKRRHL